MPRKIRTTPRKLPQQDRSQSTVDALLTATARVLVQDGYDRASTNRIAQAAGISIGSLYQYFPNKEALVAALVEQMIQEELAVLHSRLGARPEAPFREIVQDLLEAMLAIHAKNPKLRRIVIEQVPRVGRLERMLDVQTEVARMIRGYMEARPKGEFKVKDLDMAAFILVHAVEAVIHATVFKRPEYLEAKQLANELSDLVLKYMTG